MLCSTYISSDSLDSSLDFYRRIEVCWRNVLQFEIHWLERRRKFFHLIIQMGQFLIGFSANVSCHGFHTAGLGPWTFTSLDRDGRRDGMEFRSTPSFGGANWHVAMSTAMWVFPLMVGFPPCHTPKWAFLVGKPMAGWYHHSRKPPCHVVMLSWLSCCQVFTPWFSSAWWSSIGIFTL